MIFVIPGYKKLKSSDRLHGNENYIFRCPLGFLEQQFSHQHSQLRRLRLLGRPLGSSLESTSEALLQGWGERVGVSHIPLIFYLNILYPINSCYKNYINFPTQYPDFSDLNSPYPLNFVPKYTLSQKP